jgi:predicted GIY-YIG superfamily endonuclease
MQDFYVYILKCGDDSYYVGHTDDIEKRIAEHELNTYDCYTSTRLPVKVMYIQTFATRGEALDSERQLKKWSRKKKDALIEEDWSKVSLLAKKKFD